jgi:hypothetical protein
MNAAQALLHQIASEEYVAAWDLLDDNLQNAITEELERAAATTAATELAPTAAHLAATTAIPYGEALDALMRAAGYVRADTTPTHTEPIHRTDPDTAWKAGPVVGEQTMRRFGLVRDDPVAELHRRLGLIRAQIRRASLNAEIDAAGKGD